MRNGRLTVTSDVPVELHASSADSTSIIGSTYYLLNAGPGEIRVGVNGGIDDGTSGLPVAEDEKAEIRHAGSIFVVSATASELAPVHVHFLVTNR